MKKCLYEKCYRNGTLNIKVSACTAEETDCSLNTEPLGSQLCFALPYTGTQKNSHLQSATFFFHEAAI